MRRRWLWWMSALVAGCTPTLDWREARVDGVLGLFPCKPVSHARTLALAGASVRMTVHACRAEETVYAVAVADVGEPARVEPALRALHEAARANVGARTAATMPLQVPGSTPNAQAGGWQLDGRRPDGAPLHEALALFAHGTRVYQATMLGGAPATAAQATFFEALRVAR